MLVRSVPILFRQYPNTIEPLKIVNKQKEVSAEFCGTMSPYPTVTMVVRAQYIEYR